VSTQTESATPAREAAVPVTADNFVRAETDMYFAVPLTGAGA
jgi:hypothetical protein